jgi:hypothetical protein
LAITFIFFGTSTHNDADNHTKTKAPTPNLKKKKKRTKKKGIQGTKWQDPYSRMNYLRKQTTMGT